MNSIEHWLSLGEINSERDLVEGERVNVILIDEITQTALESIELMPPSDGLSRYDWPRLFADHINATAVCLRAGAMQADGTFKTESSSYLNRLWTNSESARTVLTTACYIDKWADLYEINAGSSLPAGSLITCRLVNKKTGVVYQTLRCGPPAEEMSRYAWPEYLSHAINRAGGLLRAGEKDARRKDFVPIGSSYRNHIWAPDGLPLVVEFSIGLCDAALKSADLVYEALCRQVHRPPPPRQEIDTWLAGFSGGKFKDITYPATDATVSDVGGLSQHLERVVLIGSYLLDTPSASSAGYVSKALDALNFYVDQNYKFSNWWHKQIGLIKEAGRGGLLLARHLGGQELLDTFIPYAMATTNTYSYNQTGANLADFASIQIIWSACAWKNSGDENYLVYLRMAADVLSELCLPVKRYGEEEGEGILADSSFSQHNASHGDSYCFQLYSGAYGAELFGRITEGMAVLSNEFSLTPAAYSSLTRTILDGMGWMGYAGHLDFHVNGRAISRSALLNTPHSAWANAVLSVADENDRKALTELIRRVDTLDETSNEHYRGGRIFWINEYLSYMGSSFCLWAKVISTRTVGGESGNGENPRGYYMGAGTYFLTRHGKEYENIQPVWDWQRLPGSTVEQVPGFSWPNITWGANMWGSDTFAGGASDGRKSVLSMTLARRNVTHAHKTVMTFNDQVVCIGTAIESSSASHPVVTSVNQCIAQGPVEYIDAASQRHSVSLGQTVTSDDIRAVYHDGFIYTFGNFFIHPCVTIELKSCSGKWSDINVGGSTSNVTFPVLSLWINHPAGETGHYLYLIAPGDSILNAHVPEAGSVIENEPSAQDEYHLAVDGSVIMGSYFGGGLTRRLTHVVNGAEETFYPEQPCTFIYERVDTQVHLTCSDPNQTLEKLTFVVRVDESGAVLKRIEVKLPQGEEKGRSVTGAYEVV
ncbi:polysaccharide lyase family 8 super-sandwich domain-containing protein [Pseudomonas viridiflava]|uniref:polysaccharide lyase family 8 super-sandwich domain-containing protein n=1 Tax=Pseudomonas viridiflava TaxID=33069 RepID=UPI000F018CA1|nr:polysaccharide lyase family 8 super-sandwich domain-containing protein [Pseudomonas viridiflava]